MSLITRKQYMDGAASHDEYFQQFATDAGRAWVLSAIGKQRLMQSTDQHFNDIPLELWDMFPYTPRALMRQAGDYPTLAGAVCIAKAIARSIKHENI